MFFVIDSNSSYCGVSTYKTCVSNTPGSACVVPSTSLVSKNMTTGNFHVHYDKPVNHTFYLTATTRGQVVGYFPFHVNIYNCG